MSLNQQDRIMPLFPDGDENEQSRAFSEWLAEELRQQRANELLETRLKELVFVPEI